MKLNYYLKNELHQLEVHQACPGCGKLDQLTVREQVISWCNDRTDYYIGCNCGWRGPARDDPIEAHKAWELRNDGYEVRSMILQNENPHFPIDGNPHIYQPFTLGKIPNGHVGVDWDIIPGTPVRVILNSEIIWAVQDSEVYGRYITALHADGYASLYAHLSKILVHKGDKVLGGTIIGLSGGAKGSDGAGQSTGWHLHLEVRVPGHLDHNKFNVDPIAYIKSYMEL